MIDKQTLKKHNLKAVPFSCIREGETFNLGHHLRTLSKHYERRLKGNTVDFSDGSPSYFVASSLCDLTVYVPVWRPCGEVAK
jgi:hypothetical protein